MKRFLLLFVTLAAATAHAATFTVNNLNDAGAGSLRAAIASANALAGADTVVFQNGLTGTITLVSGALEVNDSLTITGPGSGVITIDGNDQNRIFLMSVFNTSFTHSISGLSITHGRPFDAGGGILSYGNNLTLDDVKVTNCIAGGAGGGLYFSGGTLAITNSVFSNNTAENASNCFELGDVGGGRGGGIYADDTASVTLDNVTCSGNGAREDGAGLGIVTSMTLASVVTISNSTFTGNTADVLGCDAKSGAGIYVAGMGNDDTLTITDSTISGNTAIAGNAGGLLLGDLDTLTIRRSTISGNSATGGYGGGLVMTNNATTLLENVTVSGNSAFTHGGAMFVQAPSMSTTIRNSTITGNSGGTSGGIRAAGGTVVTLRNSIVANSLITPANTATADLSNDGTSSFNVTYSNIELPGAATITDGGGNVMSLDPVLGPLQNNGGTTFTHVPDQTSPAVDAGDPAFVAPPATDQRGLARVVNTVIDMGSVEFNPPPGAGTLAVTSTTFSGAENSGNIVVSVKRTAGSVGAISVDYAISNGTATAPADYTIVSGTLNWANGDTANKTFNIPITDDSIYEGNETINVTLSNVTGGAALGTANAVATITENEAFPKLTINNVSAAEGNAGTSSYQFTVTLSPQSASIVTVNFATVNGTANNSDYNANTGMLTFAVGVTTQNLIISVLGDTTTENDETFTVVLSSPTNASLGVPSTGTGTIQNDDPPTTPMFFSATAIAPTNVSLTWVASTGAANYQIERQSSSAGAFVPIGTSATASYNDLTAAANTTYKYRIRAANAFGGVSAYAGPDIATTVVFTDGNLLGGVEVQAAHLSELRTAINAVRAFTGTAAFSFTDTATAGLSIKAIHITQLRTALDAVAAAAGITVGGFTDASLSGVTVKAIHWNELRNRVK